MQTNTLTKTHIYKGADKSLARPWREQATAIKGFDVHNWRNISTIYEGWNFNSGNYLFTTDTK